MNDRKAVLVSLPYCREKDPAVTPGHASLAAAVVAHGKSELLEFVVPAGSLDLHQRLEAIVETLSVLTADTLVGVGAYVWNEEPVRNLVRMLRHRGYRGKIVAGGPSVSYTAPGHLERFFPAVDYFIRGYGETALLQLLDGDVNYPGIAVAGRPDRGTVAQQRFDQLPSPWCNPGRLVGSRGSAWWETKRGCLFNCAFCQHPGPRQPRGLQEFPLARLRWEARQISMAGITDLKIIDPLFNAPRTNYLKIIRMLREEGYQGRIAVEARFEFVTQEFVSQCAQLGVFPEFGIQTVIPEEERAIGRRNHHGQIRAAVELLHKYHVPFLVSLLFGIPLQTPPSFQLSIDFAKSLAPRRIEAYRLGLYRGSRLEQQREKWGPVVAEQGLPLVRSTTHASASDVDLMAMMGRRLRAERLSIHSRIRHLP